MIRTSKGVVFAMSFCAGCVSRGEPDARPDTATFDAHVLVVPDGGTDGPTDPGQRDTPDAWVDPFVAPPSLDDAAVRGIDPTRLFAGSGPCRAPVLVRVRRVVDGDTARVTPPGGGPDEVIRLIGVNAPEIAHAPGEVSQCYGDEATVFTRLLEGHLVWLTFDQTCQDPYMRTLAYVHTGPESDGLWQRQMLRRGFALAYILGRNRALETRANDDQATAVAARRGLWGACS